MINRQRTILYMIREAGRPLSRMEITKWCFLLGHECESKGGNAFYQFVPYHYGPFSFCLYREADSLVRDGFLEAPNDKTWQLRPDALGLAGDLPTDVKQDVDRILERFRHKSVDQTIGYVYQRYPWFTINSKLERRMERPLGTPSVHTAGYEGLQVDGFLNMLLRHGISCLIDIRDNPVARRYGFHKSSLSRLAGNLGIEYVHVPELGIPSEYRRDLRTTDDYESLFSRYETEILGNAGLFVEKVATLMQSKPSVLVCMEADPSRCHRLRLAHHVSRHTGLPIVNLEHIE